jgi:quercetin dioxygenase-like cupin family protein
MTTSALLATPGAGTAAPIRRFHTLVRVRGEASAGAASVVEHTLEPGCLSMPVHRHAAATEVLHVLDGALVLWLDGAELAAPAGTSVVVPAGAAHTFWVDPDAPRAARVLAVFAPGGMERYFEEVAAHVPALGTGRGPDMAGVLAASARHGVEVEMASLYELIGRHGLALA